MEDDVTLQDPRLSRRCLWTLQSAEPAPRSRTTRWYAPEDGNIHTLKRAVRLMYQAKRYQDVWGQWRYRSTNLDLDTGY